LRPTQSLFADVHVFSTGQEPNIIASVSSERTEHRMIQPPILVAIAIVVALTIALVYAVALWLFRAE
jgi:hypothetical protein